MSGFSSDLRYAIRSLRRGWRFALGVVLTLGLGVGLGVPVLSLADHYFLRPPPGVADPDHTVRLIARTPGRNGPFHTDGLTGLDYAVMWWSPTTTGKGKILFDDGTGRFMYIDNAKRYAAGEWKKGEPKLFDTSNSISQFNGLPASDAVPDYPCTGCPSTKS